MSQKAKGTGTLLSWTEGSPLVPTGVEADVIPNTLELFARARAWFYTMAYVCVRKWQWFDLHTAIFASERIFELIQVTKDKMAPPLTHFLKAWCDTVNFFSEQVRITGSPLSQIVMATGSWEHKWTWSAPATISGGSAAPDLPEELTNNMLDAREQARSYQSMVDRQKHADNMRSGNFNGGGGGGNRNVKNTNNGNGNGNGRGGGGGKGSKKNNYNRPPVRDAPRDRGSDRDRRDRSRDRR